MITYHSQNITFPCLSKSKTTHWIKTVAQQYERRIGNIAFVFCSDECILNINRDFLQHDYYTDIITFDYSEKNIISGELYISLDTVKTNAEKFGESFERELHRVIIHGILHLCGQNDQTSEEQAEMRMKEEWALANIEIGKT